MTVGRTARSTPPTLLHAPVEEETLAQWLRCQSKADRKPIPPRGVTQVAPARVLDAMATAINKMAAPTGMGAAVIQITGKD